VWRQSITTLLAVIDDLDHQLAVLEAELRPHRARRPPRQAADEHPRCVAELLGLTIASEIGDIARFPSARKLVGYFGLTPTIKQSGQSSRTGRLSKAGADTLRWAAVEAAQHAWRATSPWYRLYTDTKTARATPPKAAVARKILIAAGMSSHDASRSGQAPPQPPSPRRERHPSYPGKLLHSSGPPRPANDLRSRDSCNTTTCADPSAERDLSTHCYRASQTTTAARLDTIHTFKTRVAGRLALPTRRFDGVAPRGAAPSKRRVGPRAPSGLSSHPYRRR
jgi:hypothetical protein